MFGLTTTRRLRAAKLQILGLQTQLGFARAFRQASDDARRRAEQDLAHEIDAHLATIRRVLADEQAATEPRPIKHPDKLWSLDETSVTITIDDTLGDALSAKGDGR